MYDDKLIRFDWAVKHLLRDKANFDILEGFLSAILTKKVKVLNLLESESNQEHEGDKFNRVDLLVEIDSHELVLVEVQVESELDFFHRIIYGTSKLITENLAKGKRYREIKKAISVSITYFNLGRGKDYLYHGTTNFVGKNYQDTLGPSRNQQIAFDIENVSEIFPEHYVIRVEKFTDEIKSAIDEWIYMLKYSEVKPEFESEHIQTASEKLRYMALDQDQQHIYRSYMENDRYHNSMVWSLQEEGRIEGRIEGREEGREERDIEVIKNSLQAGLSLETIATITQMNVEQVLQIKQKLDDSSS